MSMTPKGLLLFIAFFTLMVLIGIGVDWYVYSTGKLQEHMTFLEYLFVIGGRH